MEWLKPVEIKEILSSQNRHMTTVNVKEVLDKIATSESLVKDNFEKDSWEQHLGKVATKRVTGLLGKKVAQIMASITLSDIETFELHIIQQIGVQMKNIAKRGSWEKDPLVIDAIKIARKYGIEQTVFDCLNLIRKQEIQELGDFGFLEGLEKSTSDEVLLSDAINALERRNSKESDSDLSGVELDF